MDNILRSLMDYMNQLAKPDPAIAQQVQQAQQKYSQQIPRDTVPANAPGASVQNLREEGQPLPAFNHSEEPEHGMPGGGAQDDPYGNALVGAAGGAAGNAMRSMLSASGEGAATALRPITHASAPKIGGYGADVLAATQKAAPAGEIREAVDPLLSRVLNSPQTERYVTEKLMHRHVLDSAAKAGKDAAESFVEKTGVGKAGGIQDIGDTPSVKILSILAKKIAEKEPVD